VNTRARATTVAALTTLALAPLMTASPAQAATDRVVDTASDPYTMDLREDLHDPARTTNPRSADIRSARVDHDRVVTLTVAVDDIRPADEVTVQAVFGKVGQASVFGVDADVRPGTDTVETAVFKNGVETRCAADRQSADVDHDRDRITLRVARSCLGTPTALRWGVSAFAYAPETFVADDARRDDTGRGPALTRLGGNVRFG
jgi:hypothetical protein